MYQSIVLTLLLCNIACYFAVYGLDNSSNMCKNENDKIKTLKLLREQSMADSLRGSSM
jgi:hypothetical protein